MYDNVCIFATGIDVQLRRVQCSRLSVHLCPCRPSSYRRVPGTACTDGELFEPVTVPCSSLSKRFGQVGEVSVRIFDGKHQDVTTGRVVTGSTVRNRTLRVYLAASVSTGYSPRVT